MQEDFHYYATYCAAYLAGYNPKESLTIATSAQFVDCCTKTLLSKVKAPTEATTTQLQGELVEARTDFIGLQDITRIWSSFHFLPYDLYGKVKALSKTYRDKYHLICKPNGCLLAKTVDLAKGSSLESVGLAMHVLADTWAHAYFAGNPSQVINNTNYDFVELIKDGDKVTERPITFRHSVSSPDDPDHSIYTSSINNGSESFIMNLGHGRAGHLPDYSFVTYRYLPAWGNYHPLVKDNPHDYYEAFCQMVYAMQYLRGESGDEFKTDTYAYKTVEPYKDRITQIIKKRQLNASGDWKAFGEEISKEYIPDFDLKKCYSDYDRNNPDSFLARFIVAAIRQKGMVTKNIYDSHNFLAGRPKAYRVKAGER